MRTLKLFLLIRWAWLASSFFTWTPWRSILSRTCRNSSLNLPDRWQKPVIKPIRFQHSSPPSWWRTVCGSCPAVCWRCWMCDCGSWTVWSYQPGYLWPRPPSPPDAPETQPTNNQSDLSLDAASLNISVWGSLEKLVITNQIPRESADGSVMFEWFEINLLLFLCNDNSNGDLVKYCSLTANCWHASWAGLC